MVPLALINLAKRIEQNWDLTVLKVCKFIDGINHVSRIAYLADCDLSLTRQAISHLLYVLFSMMPHTMFNLISQLLSSHHDD